MRNTKMRLVAIALAAAMMIGDTGSAVFAAEIEPQSEPTPIVEEVSENEESDGETEGKMEEESTPDENSGTETSSEDSTESQDGESTEGEEGSEETKSEEETVATEEETSEETAEETSEETTGETSEETTEEATEEATEGTAEETKEEITDADIIITDEFKKQLDEYVYGSDGKAYDGVEYITYRAFLALDAEGQDAYLKLCEEAALLSEYADNGNVVLSTNEDGEVSLGVFMTFQTLDEMFEDMNLATPEVGEDTPVEAVTEEETEEEAEDTNTDSSAEGSVEDSEAADETVAETEESEATETASTDSEEKTADAETIEVTSVDDLTDEVIAELGLDVPVSENEDELAAIEVEEEDIEIVEDEPLDIEIDLSEINDDGSVNTLDTSLSAINAEKYFYNQLSSSGKQIFDAGKGRLTKGKNSFTYSGYAYSYYILSAYSALVLTYPGKLGWLGKGSKDGVSWRWTYRCGSGYKTTVTFSKSKFYKGSLQSAANKKVNALVSAAYSYARTYYPNKPSYGMVKYFNQWLCQNNYYSRYMGVTSAGASQNTAQYYYCHSPYGALLKGYAVCESYALAMTMLLDKAGITNIYAVGPGHAWNYVYMPNRQWYLQDTTWNDTAYGTDNPGQKSYTENYLLIADDGAHYPDGEWFYNQQSFSFPTRAGSRYSSGNTEAISLNITGIRVVKPKAKLKLAVTNTVYKNYIKNWSSSNKSVATVNSKGQVVAKKPGAATITCSIGGMTSSMTVVVYKFTGLTFTSNKKKSCKVTYINENNSFASPSAVPQITINVNQSGRYYSASDLRARTGIAAPTVSSSKSAVATASASLDGNQIYLTVSPHKVGVTTFTVKFAGKSCKVKYTVKQRIQWSWFQPDISNAELRPDAQLGTTIPYVKYNKGKPVKTVKIVKTPYIPKGVTYKIVYKNNKKRGALGTVSVVGTKYYVTEPGMYVTFRIY